MTEAAASGRRAAAPVPLLIGFAVFIVAMAYLVAASLTRRSAPTFAPTVGERARAAHWERVGDTITVDATDGKAWRYVSLERGRVLAARDTTRWDLAVRRYNVRVNGEAIDFGEADFTLFGTPDDVPRAVLSFGAGRERGDVGKWYQYSLLTHLLEPNEHVYVVRTHRGPTFKLQFVSYYCPGLTAGCMTMRYAPLPQMPRSSLR
jgi:HmuY protein